MEPSYWLALVVLLACLFHPCTLVDCELSFLDPVTITFRVAIRSLDARGNRVPDAELVEKLNIFVEFLIGPIAITLSRKISACQGSTP